MSHVFVIEYTISAYDGSVMIGAASTLEKAVAHLAKMYRDGHDSFDPDPFNCAVGHTITEYQLDNFNRENVQDDTLKIYDGQGNEWKWSNTEHKYIQV